MIRNRPVWLLSAWKPAVCKTAQQPTHVGGMIGGPVEVNVPVQEKQSRSAGPRESRRGNRRDGRSCSSGSTAQSATSARERTAVWGETCRRSRLGPPSESACSRGRKPGTAGVYTMRRHLKTVTFTTRTAYGPRAAIELPATRSAAVGVIRQKFVVGLKPGSRHGASRMFSKCAPSVAPPRSESSSPQVDGAGVRQQA
jgi:hypothetical protein